MLNKNTLFENQNYNFLSSLISSLKLFDIKLTSSVDLYDNQAVFIALRILKKSNLSNSILYSFNTRE